MKPFAPFILLLSCIPFLISCEKDEPKNPGGGGNGNVKFDVKIGSSVIPYIVIETQEKIQNEPKIPADMTIFVEKEIVQSLDIGIEYRGSTSFRLSDKKSFGIETWDEAGNDLETSIFNWPLEEDWILNGHIVNLQDGWILDRTMMYHYLGYNLFRDMGRYGARTKFVELELNGDYQGVYVFMEKLKRDNERIDIERLESSDEDDEAITGGYILKIDKTAGGDLNLNQPLEYFLNNWEDDARYTPEISFRSQYDINGETLNFEPYDPPYHPNQYLETYFLYEYPKASNITGAQKAYIQQYIHDFETALLTDDFSTDVRTYTDYIDLESFVDFFIINEVCRNVDGYRLSTWMYKDRGGKLKMGPIWDLNIGYDTGGRIPWDDWVINYNQYVATDPWSMPFWWPRLMEDPVFRQSLKDRWTSLRSGALSTSTILGRVDEAANLLINNGAIERNYDQWATGENIDYNEAISSLKGYLEFRTQWMDTEIGAM